MGFEDAPVAYFCCGVGLSFGQVKVEVFFRAGDSLYLWGSMMRRWFSIVVKWVMSLGW